ncbi:TetR/AcrR family transcriptional regulator [Arcobacter sp.]|uniref:TetR/AcrR family transcriptional regulator n=1 Tax=unclassified Arcobacter TaxID=2593671 RepID=UPI003AFFF783
MAIKKTSKEEILKESIKLFKIRGYHNTSMANIAESCGLIKGSIYHHFKSKDEIGLESLKYIHKYFIDNIFSIAYRGDLSDKEKQKLFISKTDDYFLESVGGCLLGNLALEVSTLNLEFKDEIKSYFLAWEKALAKILESKYGKDISLKLAKEYVSLTQGEIMMMNLFDSKKRYLSVGEKITQLL